MQVEITNGQKNQAVILYYKGDILTLWLFLSNLFDRYDDQTLLSCDTLSTTPHLAFLLLLRIECSMLIHDSSSTLDKRLHEIWRFSRDFFILTQIIRTQSRTPELKTKAMALRVMMTMDPATGTVHEIWRETPDSDHSQQTKAVQEAKRAIRIHKEYTTDNGDILKFTLAFVKDTLGTSQFEAANFAVKARLLDRSELYFSHQMLVSVLEAAVATKSCSCLRHAIRYAKETTAIGEWGGMFGAGWWLNQRLELADTELWKRAMDGGVWGEKVSIISTDERYIAMLFFF